MKRFALLFFMLYFLFPLSSKAATNTIKMIDRCNHTNAIVTSDGILWIYGNNTEGQCGFSVSDDWTSTVCSPVYITDDVKYVSLGGTHTAVIKNDNTLWMCGSNYYGQLGDGTTINRPSLVKVMTGVKSVSCGAAHTAILKTDGSLWMCGSNIYGEIGTGSSEAIKQPVKIMTDVVSVDACYNNTAIVKKDGSLFTCGYNYHGQLGCNTNENSNKPVLIAQSVKMASFGAAHLLILKKDGSVWACGAGNCGALGNNDWENKLIPVKVMTGVRLISAGSEYSAFIKNDNTLWTCGLNMHSQLGDGTTEDRFLPVQVDMNVKDVVASESTLILKEDGSIWMCGEVNPLESSEYIVYSKPVKLYEKGFGKSHISGLKITNYNSLPNAFQQYYIGFKASSWSDRVYVMLFDIEGMKTTTKIVVDSLPSIMDGKISHDIFYHYRNGNWFLNGSQIGFGQIPVSNILFSNIDIYDSEGNVICKANSSGTVKEKGLELNKSTVSLNKGDSATLKLTMNGITGTVSWSSSNKSVATVTSSGKVTAKKAGTATITAKVGNYKATCKVTVTASQKTSTKVTVKINKEGVKKSETYKDSFFDNPENDASVSNNLNLLRLSALGAASTYGGSSKSFLKQCGFDNAEKYFTGSGNSSTKKKNDNCTIFHGSQTINVKVGGKKVERRIIGIVVSGYSGDGYEWISNFEIGSGNRHYGFDTAANKALSFIKDKYKIKQNDIVWICGHSRGAAVANLMAADLMKTSNYVFAYCFATPNVAKKGYYKSDIGAISTPA